MIILISAKANMCYVMAGSRCLISDIHKCSTINTIEKNSPKNNILKRGQETCIIDKVDINNEDIKQEDYINDADNKEMQNEEIKVKEIKDEEIYDDTGGETKISRISTNKDETGNIINSLCIQELLSSLSKRDKQIIILRYYKGKTQNEVAKMLGITQVQVSRIERKILDYMKEKLVS